MAKRRKDVQTGMSLKAPQVKDIVDRLFVRHREFQQGIVHNREMFYRAKICDPVMGETIDPGGNSITKYQTNAPLEVMLDALPRLTENPWVIDVAAPRDTSTQNRNANNMKVVLQSGFGDVETRNGERLQTAMGALQIRDGCAVLQWYPMPEIWGTEVEYEWADELPEDEGEAKRFEDMGSVCPECEGIADWGDEPKPCPECEGAGMVWPEDGRYRETHDAFQERRAGDRARAGFPVCVEVLDPLHVAWERGRGQHIGFSRVAIKMELSRVDYDAARQDGLEPSKVPQASWTIAPGEQMGQGEAATGHETPSSQDFRERVTVYQLWNMALKGKGREPEFEFYELMSPNGDGEDELVKAFKRPGARMNSFAVAAAIRLKHADPVLEYQPFLQGIYNLKPFLDRYKTLMGALVEMNAQPLYYYRRVGSGVQVNLLGAEGKDALMTRNTILSQAVPEGFEIATVEFHMEPAMALFMAQLQEEFLAAKPPAGTTEIGATTAPWAAQIGIKQATASLAMLVREQANVLEVMVQDTAYTMSLETVEEGGFGEPVSMWGRTKDGAVDRSKVVSVEPKDVESLHVAVTISPTSSSERIATTQAATELLALGLITEEDFQEIRGVENPADYVTKLLVERLSKPFKEQELKRMIAAWFGPRAFLGVNGQTMDAYGHPLVPQQVLQANGFEQGGKPEGPSAAQGGLGNQGDSTPGPLSDLDVPGAGVVAGMPG